MEYKVARSRKLRTIPMGRRIERALSRESNVPVLFGISSSIFQTVIRVKRCWGEEEIFFLDLWICSACLCPLYLASSWGLVGRARFPPARSNLSSLLTAFAGRPVPQSLDLLELRALHSFSPLPRELNENETTIPEHGVSVLVRVLFDAGLRLLRGDLGITPATWQTSLGSTSTARRRGRGGRPNPKCETSKVP